MSPKKRKVFEYLFISCFVLIGIAIAIALLKSNWLIVVSLGTGWIIFEIVMSLLIPGCFFVLGGIIFSFIEDLLDDGKLNHSNKKEK